MKLQLALCLALLAPGAVRAGLEVCNETDIRQTVAVGYKDGGDWVSEGWWLIEPGSCKLAVSGDLKNRYYYYRAEVEGVARDGAVTFCTTRKAFTITGDKDCVARGYESNAFRRVDTGKTAKQFTLTLVTATGAAAPSPEPEPEPEPEPVGSDAEPYAAAAILQGCYDGEPRSCAFHEGGTKVFVYDDGRSPQFVFTVMAALDPGTPIVVEGMLTGIFDSTAEVVLRDITVRPWDDAAAAMNRLQGTWYALDDPNAQFTVLGAERDNSYDGVPGGTDYLWIGPGCGGFGDDGPYLMARAEEGQEVLCYGIASLEDWSMELIYLPRGNVLSYRKLD